MKVGNGCRGGRGGARTPCSVSEALRTFYVGRDFMRKAKPEILQEYKNASTARQQELRKEYVETKLELSIRDFLNLASDHPTQTDQSMRSERMEKGR